mmetsp:Transcript_33630/g.60154  ORF Transcript_33630/g.60154 Transcript_33630/m.60154 type:complete len:213 (+) Transcript_33630:93-731(+)
MCLVDRPVLLGLLRRLFGTVVHDLSEDDGVECEREGIVVDHRRAALLRDTCEHARSAARKLHKHGDYAQLACALLPEVLQNLRHPRRYHQQRAHPIRCVQCLSRQRALQPRQQDAQKCRQLQQGQHLAGLAVVVYEAQQHKVLDEEQHCFAISAERQLPAETVQQPHQQRDLLDLEAARRQPLRVARRQHVGHLRNLHHRRAHDDAVPQRFG